MFLIGNWKMHGSFNEVTSFIEEVDKAPAGVDPVLCFPFPYLKNLALLLRAKGYNLGAQDCSDKPLGPFTGQVSASMLKDIGCNYVIVGHPERASFETDEQVFQKAERAIESGLTPIICITALGDIPKRVSLSFPCLIAYEPAVGSNALPSDLEGIAKQLKESAGQIPVLYGGGVNPENLKDIVLWFDGFLVGRASLNSTSWNQLLNELGH